MGAHAHRSVPPDAVTEYYKKDVDRTLLREHLKLTPQQRLERLVAFMRSLDALREAHRRRVAAVSSRRSSHSSPTRAARRRACPSGSTRPRFSAG